MTASVFGHIEIFWVFYLLNIQIYSNSRLKNRENICKGLLRAYGYTGQGVKKYAVLRQILP